MKITYIANVRLPTEKAHGIQIMKMCEAFKRAGHDIELVLPWRSNDIKEDPFVYYSIKDKFPVKKIFSLDLVRFGAWGFSIQSLTFALSAFLYTAFSKPDVVFGRDELPLLLISLYNKTVWETHTGSYNFSAKLLLKTNARIIAITQGLKNFYINHGVAADRVLVAPDSADAEQFDINIGKDEARARLGLEKDKKIALYTGHLYDWKGAHILAKAAGYLPEDTIVVFVGGTDKHIESFKKRFFQIPQIRILGMKPYSEIPLYLKAADVLVLPNSPVNDVSSRYTSPMKLFEYMASGRPIVASDLPSIREVLSEENSVLVAPDDPHALSEAIQAVVSDESLQSALGARAYQASKRYTWKTRAETIVSFIKA